MSVSVYVLMSVHVCVSLCMCVCLVMSIYVCLSVCLSAYLGMKSSESVMIDEKNVRMGEEGGGVCKYLKQYKIILFE